MKLKYISKLLASSILISNINISSFAGTLSEDGRYETFKESNITIDNVLEEDMVDVEIEGNTLVNLADYKAVYSDKYNIEFIENGFTISGADNKYINARIPVSLIKPNTTYTLFADKESIVLPDNGQQPYIDIYNGTTYIASQWFKYNKTVFTTSDTIDDFHLRFVITNDIAGTAKGLFKNIMVLEGNWSNKEIPEYFEGMQSSFENSLVTQSMVNSGEEKPENLGKYKAEVKSTGKNILNANNNTVSKWTGDAKNHLITPIKLQVGKTYTFSYFNEEDTDKSYRINIAAFNNGEFVKNIAQIGGDYGEVTKTATFTLNESYDEYYLEAHILYDNVSMSLKVQLEEGSSMTEYEPYKESVKVFYLNEPLRGLPSGTKDRIIEKNGQLYVERNIKEVIYDGSSDELWYLNNDNTIADLSLFTIIEDGDTSNTSEDNLLSNRMPSKESLWSNDINAEGVDMARGVDWSYKDVHVKIKSYKLSTLDETGFKEWLRDNNLMVIYKIDNPTYEYLGGNSSIQLYKGATYITNNSNMPADMKIVVDRVANRALEAIERAKGEPSIDNISQARYWSNLMKETLLKDEFQDELNTVTNIEDVYIEKKTVSVNADVYIKMKNTLSLSIDTNSIVFNDVDSTEDTEMQNAVNLTVSSSLPYRVNSYLEGEIYNIDKTRTLDSSILNIKSSKDVDYKAFASIDAPILLLDDQEAGVDTIHGIDLKIASNNTSKADVYKAVIKFEVEQK